MRRLSADDVRDQKLRELGLSGKVRTLTDPAALASAFRRVAASLCPCSAATLIRAVHGPLRGLVPSMSAAKTLVEATLEAMVAHGDLLEQRIDDPYDSNASALLDAAPPSFVVRQSGAVVLLGVDPEHSSSLPDELKVRVKHRGHVRLLLPTCGEDLKDELRQLGIIELSHKVWLKTPPRGTAYAHLQKREVLLNKATPSREIPGLRVLLPERPVRYYPKRWDYPNKHTGRYVARRSQAYGADLWCYVELRSGQPKRMIDLPSRSTWRGCDEAWHLQMAIDATRREPQRFRVRRCERDAVLLEIFSPVPSWAQRRWDALGEPVPGAKYLFAYRIPNSEIDEELDFAREALWLAEETDATH